MVGEETPGGKGMTEANKERLLVLDDMEDGGRLGQRIAG